MVAHISLKYGTVILCDDAGALVLQNDLRAMRSHDIYR